MKPVCKVAALTESVALSSVLAWHRDRCLRCQADTARRVGIARDLRSLRAEVASAPPGTAEAVMMRLGTQDAADPRGPLVLRIVTRWAAAGGMAAATLATLAGVALRRRSRAVG